METPNEGHHVEHQGNDNVDIDTLQQVNMNPLTLSNIKFEGISRKKLTQNLG